MEAGPRSDGHHATKGAPARDLRGAPFASRSGQMGRCSHRGRRHTTWVRPRRSDLRRAHARTRDRRHVPRGERWHRAGHDPGDRADAGPRPRCARGTQRRRDPPPRRRPGRPRSARAARRGRTRRLPRATGSSTGRGTTSPSSSSRARTPSRSPTSPPARSSSPCGTSPSTTRRSSPWIAAAPAAT